MRAVLRLAAVLLVCVPTAGHAALNSLPSNAEYSNVKIELVNPNSFPAKVTNGIDQAVNVWNGSTCNVGADDFPVFSRTQAGQATLKVEWHTGLSPIDPNTGNQVCAKIDPGGTTNGSNSTIHLYEKVPVEGSNRTCYTNKDIADDSFAHEMAHYLGLGHPNAGCEGDHITGPRGHQFINGIFVWKTNRKVTTEECTLADSRSWTPDEQTNEGGGGGSGGTECPFAFEGFVTCGSSPILLDLDGDGLDLVGLGDTVLFDINADGIADEVTWTSGLGKDGFLVYDRNGNGRVDDGSELFGNSSLLRDGSLAPHGFRALAELDEESAGGNFNLEIDGRDKVYDVLGVWFDFNHNGVSEADELFRLSQLGISRLEFSYLTSQQTDEHGNQLLLVSRGWLSLGEIEVPFDSIDVFLQRIAN